MYSAHYYLRKTHRYLGVFIGIQFLLWTVGGLYFSWTNIDEIHGDHLVNRTLDRPDLPSKLLPLEQLMVQNSLSKDSLLRLELSPSHNGWYYSVYSKSKPRFIQFDAETGQQRSTMTRSEAIHLAALHYRENTRPDSAVYITQANIASFSDYRGGDIPAWGIHYSKPENTWLYLNARRHHLEKVRTNRWKIFDFLWMLHIMDFDERDNINNTLLRIFSLLGLFTILSGFILFWISSRTIRKWKKSLRSSR